MHKSETIAELLGLDDFLLIGRLGDAAIYCLHGNSERLREMLRTVLATSGDVAGLLVEATSSLVEGQYGVAEMAAVMDDASFLQSVRKEILF